MLAPKEPCERALLTAARLKASTLVYFYLINVVVTIILFTMFTAILTNFFLEQVAQANSEHTPPPPETSSQMKHCQVSTLLHA